VSVFKNKDQAQSFLNEGLLYMRSSSGFDALSESSIKNNVQINSTYSCSLYSMSIPLKFLAETTEGLFLFGFDDDYLEKSKMLGDTFVIIQSVRDFIKRFTHAANGKEVVYGLINYKEVKSSENLTLFDKSSEHQWKKEYAFAVLQEECDYEMKLGNLSDIGLLCDRDQIQGSKINISYEPLIDMPDSEKEYLIQNFLL